MCHKFETCVFVYTQIATCLCKNSEMRIHNLLFVFGAPWEPKMSFAHIYAVFELLQWKSDHLQGSVVNNTIASAKTSTTWRVGYQQIEGCQIKES